MRKIPTKNKKALSEIVSYVLLIIIAISLSVAVYAWLEVYVPKNTVECEQGASVVIKDFSCNTIGKKLNELGMNKGHKQTSFLIDGSTRDLRCYFGIEWKKEKIGKLDTSDTSDT